ncbi:MAG TPA: M48 family metallopeptidase [Thermoanaerobaculia bacterium]|jgi:predicted Zn-dependent protease
MHTRQTLHRNVALPSALLVAALGLAVYSAAPRSSEGFDLISVDQEWAMRNEIFAQAAQQKPLVNDPAAMQYLNAIGRRIAAQTPYGNRRWDFFVVRDPSVNAFNLPGGLVFVNSGLIGEADTLDELADVMAHEIGHGAARHGTQTMTRAYGYNLLARLVMGRNPGMIRQITARLVGTGVMNHYSRDAERQADALGVQYATRAGFDPQGFEDFFGKLARLQKTRPSKVGQFFSDHPLTQERIQNVAAEIAQLPRHAALIRDSPQYQQFRARFAAVNAAVPAPPARGRTTAGPR